MATVESQNEYSETGFVIVDGDVKLSKVIKLEV